MRCLSLFLALLLAPATPLLAKAKPAAAQPARIEARPALWMVRDADTTIYLFGTIHLLKPEIDWFHGPVRTAFNRSGEAVLEIADREDAAKNQPSMLERAMAPDSPPLSGRLPAGQGAKYLAALEQNGVPVALFDHVKPWFATFSLSIIPLKAGGYDPASGADHTLERMATAQGKTLVGLETTAQQLGFFENMPETLQLELLSETIDELPTLNQTIERMIAAWSRGDAKGLADLMNESIDTNPEFERILLTDRNARWADWIKARMDRPGTVFLAVGTGHLAGRNSVQSMLEARGLVVRRVDRQR